MNRRRSEDGAAVVEFVMVIGLVLLLFAGIIELALMLHVRDVVTADAAEGARYEANAGASAGSGGPKAQQLMASTLGPAAGSLRCSSTRAAGEVAVTCAGNVSLPILPLSIHLSQTGHALLEIP